MVLTHTSGLPNWRKHNELKFTRAPESKFSYSGEGFVWLQKTIEHIVGKSFEQVAQDLVFSPLAMIGSSFIWENRFEENFATPHDEIMFPSEKWKPTKPNAASSLQTTTSDYAKFLQELIKPKYISKDFRDKMLENHVTVKTYKHGKEKVIWGLGISIQETNNSQEFYHWGDNWNVKSYFVVSPKQNKGIVYLTNSKNGLAMTEEITDMFIGTPQIGYKRLRYKVLGKLYRLKSMFKRKNTHNKT